VNYVWEAKRTYILIKKKTRIIWKTMEYPGSLIKADGEKTRELINKVLGKIPG